MSFKQKGEVFFHKAFWDFPSIFLKILSKKRGCIDGCCVKSVFLFWMSVAVLIYLFFFFPLQIYLKNKDLYTVEANNPRQLVEIAARDIEKLLSNRSKALVVSTNWLHFLFTIKIHTYICIFESHFFFFFSSACTLMGSVSLICTGHDM